jgi:hypothetical protein
MSLNIMIEIVLQAIFILNISALASVVVVVIVVFVVAVAAAVVVTNYLKNAFVHL